MLDLALLWKCSPQTTPIFFVSTSDALSLFSWSLENDAFCVEQGTVCKALLGGMISGGFLLLGTHALFCECVLFLAGWEPLRMSY